MINKMSKSLIALGSILIVSCTTQQATAPSLIDGDIYTGTESVKYLADGVADRVFFATNKYNISSRGIDTVKDYLIANGIALNRIKVVSYGKERPVNPASTAIAWSQNRRTVTVKIN